MSAAVLCPGCGGRVTPGGGRWAACPACRETFAAEDARPAPDTPADRGPVVFEEIGEDPAPPPPKRPRRPKPAANPATAPKPPRAPRHEEPAESGGWFRDTDLSDPDWGEVLAPPPRPKPQKAPGNRRARKPKRRRVSRRDWPVTIGTIVYAVIAIGCVGVGVFTASHELSNGTGPDVIDYVRWVITAFVLLLMWGGSRVARGLWVGLMGVAVLLSAAALVATRGEIAPDVPNGAERLADVRAQSIAAVTIGTALIVLLCSPWFSAFLAHRRGER